MTRRATILAVSGTLAMGGQACAATLRFDATYLLDSQASQAAFRPGSKASCVPSVRQRERQSVTFSIVFAGAFPAIAGRSTTLHSRTLEVSGRHTWDERSALCARYPAGRVTCLSRPQVDTATLVVQRTRAGLELHPKFLLQADGGCKGEVFNEHPDCGARDGAAVLDFAFQTALRAHVPTLATGRRQAAFDVRHDRGCARPGSGTRARSASTRSLATAERCGSSAPERH